MEPHVLCRRVYFLSQNLESLPFATPHLVHLLIEAAIDGHSKEVEVYDNVIHKPKPPLLPPRGLL